MFSTFVIVFNTVKKLLEGKKTYAISFAVLLCVLIEKGFGWDVPGFVTPENWQTLVFEAAGLGTLRAGVGKIIKNFNLK